MLPTHCNMVSVTDVGYDLDPHTIASRLLGLRAFTRTEYMVLRRGGEFATARVVKKRSFHLFRPIVEVVVFSTPGNTLYLKDDVTDTLNPTRMYRTALGMVEEAEKGGRKPVGPEGVWVVWRARDDGGEGGTAPGGGGPAAWGREPVMGEAVRPEQMRVKLRRRKREKRKEEEKEVREKEEALNGGLDVSASPAEDSGAGGSAAEINAAAGGTSADPLNGWTAVVEGGDGHISFITRPAPITIHVLDLVPPRPSKMEAMVDKAADFVETGGEPLEFHFEIVDIEELAERERIGRGSAPAVMFPCEVSGAGDACAEGGGPKGGAVYLDKTPELTEEERDATLVVGCDTSRMIFRSLYRKEPELVNVCPADLVENYPAMKEGPALLRCCKMYGRYERKGGIVKLPWGPTPRMVAEAIEELIGEN